MRTLTTSSGVCVYRVSDSVICYRTSDGPRTVKLGAISDTDLAAVQEFLAWEQATPKPWHDAQPGEAWVVHTDGVGEELLMIAHESEYGGIRFRQADEHGTIWALDTTSIRGGRRIWPEVSDASS